MKKITSLFLVLILISSFVGCGSTAGEETATTLEAITMSHEEQVEEIVQWTIINIINKNSTTRFADASLYKDVKEEVESYISTLPSSRAPMSISIELANPGLFKIEILF